MEKKFMYNTETINVEPPIHERKMYFEKLEKHEADYNTARRIQYNKKLIGKKVYVLTHAGWYGFVNDLYDVDDFIIQRPSGKEFLVNIHDIRQLED